MTIKLIHHSEESKRQKSSPIDEAIRELMTEQNLMIVCPYLGIDYIQEILGGCKSWQLLTDIEAWLELHKRNMSQLPLIENFVKENIEHIHHYPGIHAKVIITRDKALVGSANFTKQGVWHREEMAVFITNEPQIKELSIWFKSLWENTYCLDENEIRSIHSYVKACLKEKGTKQNASISLDLRLPKGTIELPNDITGEQVGNLQLFTVKEITSQIEKEETILQDSARYWIYYLINHGKIRAYRFRSILLLDKEGVQTLWQFRSQIRDGRKNRDVQRRTRDVIKIPNDQLLTI